MRNACVVARSEVSFDNEGSEIVEFTAGEEMEGMALVMASVAVVIAGLTEEESGGKSHEMIAE